MSTVTGADQIITFVIEDSFGQDPRNGLPADTNFKAFGTNESMDSQDRDQNSERMYRPFSRQADEVLEGAFDGSWSIDFTLTNGHWLRFIYGDPTKSSNTYTFTLSSTNPPVSAHIIEETHFSNGDIEQTVYTGCTASSASMDVSVEDPVDGSLDGEYVTEITRNTGDGDTLLYGDASGGLEASEGGQPDTQVRPLHFGNSELRLDYDGGGTVDDTDFVALTQDASLDFEGNVELESELGTRFKAAQSFLNFEPDLSYTSLIDADSQSEKKRRMYGSSSAEEPQESVLDAELDGELFMDAGLSGEQNEFTFTLTGTFPDSFSRNNIGSPEDVIEEDIDRYISEVTVEVISDQYDLTA